MEELHIEDIVPFEGDIRADTEVIEIIDTVHESRATTEDCLAFQSLFEEAVSFLLPLTTALSLWDIETRSV